MPGPRVLSDQAYAPYSSPIPTRHINMRDLIPGGKIHDAGLGQAEDGLEFPHRRGGSRSVNAIRIYPRNAV